MPSMRARQLKAVIDVSKNIDMYKGKGDYLFSMIDALEADLNNQNPEANSYSNPTFAYVLYSYIMENQSYFTQDKERQNNIMIAYSLLSAFDGELAKNVKEQINADPINQKGLRLYNYYLDPYAPKKNNVVEDGPIQQKMYAIKAINKSDKQPLSKEDLTKIENIRKLYKFMTKEGDPILHINTDDFLKMREEMKKLLDYVDTAKGSVDKSILSEHIDILGNKVNNYIKDKLEKNKAPKTPLGKARLAAAMAVLENINEKRAHGFIEKYRSVTDFKSELIDSVLKKSDDGKDIVDTKPLVETVKEEKRVPNAEAIQNLKVQLDNLQKEINAPLMMGYEKMKLMAKYVVINEIKNQLITKDDGTILDNPKVDENVYNLYMNTQFLLATTPLSGVGEVDMKEFCKNLPAEMAKKGAEAEKIDLVSVDPFKKENMDKEKAQDKSQDIAAKEDINNMGPIGIS